MGKKRLYRSFLGIPIWMITGVALFILFSALYDYLVWDRSDLRNMMMLGSGLLLLLLSGVLHIVPLSFLARQSKRQMGG